MPTLTLTTQVDAPAEVVFANFADFENAAQKVSGIKRIELLTDGPIGKGTRFRETRVMFKKEATETMEITEYDPPNSYAVEGESCGSRWRAEFRFFSESPNRTRVEMQTTLTAVTFFAKLMSPLSRLMMNAMRKCMEQDIADMKRAAEGVYDSAASVGAAAPTASTM